MALHTLPLLYLVGIVGIKFGNFLKKKGTRLSAFFILIAFCVISKIQYNFYFKPFYCTGFESKKLTISESCRMGSIGPNEMEFQVEIIQMICLAFIYYLFLSRKS